MIVRRLAVLLIGAMATSPASDPSRTESPFVFCVSHRAPKGVARSFFGPAVAIRAAYRQLDPANQRELRDALHESVSRREARLNPFLEDLDDGDPDTRLERLLESAPVTFGVARALLAPQFCGSDGFCVRVTANTCTGLEHPARSEEVDRARFLAWPYGYATRVRVDGANDVSHAAGELRLRRNIALVLERPGTASTALEDEVLALFEQHERLLRLEGGSASREADEGETARVTNDPEGVIDERELLLIPTLEAVAAALSSTGRP